MHMEKFGCIWGNAGSAAIRIKIGSTSSSVTNSSVTSTGELRGEISTKYDENATISGVNPNEKPYSFNNETWIGFVYKNALNISVNNTKIMLETSGNFDDENKVFLANNSNESSLIKDGEIIDISKLVTEGKISAGDVFYIANGTGGGEYVLYVGGGKIIYATKPTIEATEEEPVSALKYEYLEHYLQKIKSNLVKGHENEENFNIPQFGVTKIYRINEEVAKKITQADTNLIFNGKGYYTISDYKGIPTEINFNGSKKVNVFTWIFDTILNIFEFILNFILYIIRMQIIGWANMVELLIQSIVLGLSGNSSWQMVADFIGPNATSASGSRLSVESIFFNQIPILDANFFNFETAGGYSLKTTQEYQPPTASGQGVQQIETINKENIVYQLRYNLKMWYNIIRNASIAIMLFILIYLGIRLAIYTAAEKKAETKKLLVSWLTAFIIVIFIHYFMYLIFQLNDALVDICKNLGNTVAHISIQNNTSTQLNLYDAVRIKAYSFSFREGVPATIIYLFLIYLLIRFLFIYFKRELTIYILALSGSLMGVKHAIEKIAGKKTTSIGKWFKDFAFNVLLQTVHTFIYILYMAIALNVAETSIAGFVLCLIILNFMLNADKIIIKIFGLNKAGSLADVDKPEKFMNVVSKALPIYYINKRMFSWAYKNFTGKRGIHRELWYSMHGYNDYKDAEKAYEKMQYEKMGKRQQTINTLLEKVYGKINVPYSTIQKKVLKRTGKNIRQLKISELAKYKAQLAEKRTFESKKAIANSIKQAKALQRRRFTRKLEFVKDSFALAGMVAAIPIGIADPTAGIATFYKSKRTIDKHRTTSRTQRKNNVYKVSKDKAKKDYIETKSKYNTALDTYTNNQFAYEEKIKELKDKYANETDTTLKSKYEQDIKDEEEKRRIASAKELHKLKETYEKMYESEIKYENSKYENSVVRKTLGKVTGAEFLADIARNEESSAYSEADKSSKENKKLAEAEKMLKNEQELMNLMDDLKRLYKQSNENGNIEETSYETDIGQTFKYARKRDVSLSTINKAITEYMYESRIDKISDENIDKVLEKLEEILSNKGSKYKITDELKGKVKDTIIEKMYEQKDNPAEAKGLGLDKKDTSAILVNIISDNSSNVSANYSPKLTKEQIKELKKKGYSSDTEEYYKYLENNGFNEEQIKIERKRNEIAQKIREMNTQIDVAKAKNGASIINMTKILKEVKKT